ncbi:MAG: type III pantothenate kinase [Phycisphaerae bacterium]
MTPVPEPRAAACLLLVEVGNSHVSIATSSPGRLSAPRRFENGAHGLVAERLRRDWRAMPGDRQCAVVLASVVPEQTTELQSAIRSDLDTDPMILGDSLPVPIEYGAVDKETVGVDRLCAAAAAHHKIQDACVVAGFGTAITIDCVDSEGTFLGGAILPGLQLQARSLHGGTAQLPRVDVRAPQAAFGRNTEEAIVNGVVYGAVGALREIVERYATELGRWPRLVVTGGGAPLIRETCDFVDDFIPDLVLRGMALAYREFFATEA